MYIAIALFFSSVIWVIGLEKLSTLGLEGSGARFGSWFLNGDKLPSGNKKLVSSGSWDCCSDCLGWIGSKIMFLGFFDKGGKSISYLKSGEDGQCFSGGVWGGVSGKLKFKDFLFLTIPFAKLETSLSLSLISLFTNLSSFFRAMIAEFWSLVL